VTLLHLAILALVQGITEFLPISSSAHLILVPALTDWPDQGPIIDIAVHIGTLFAVIFYFRRDMSEMFLGLGDIIRGKISGGSKLALMIFLATLPIIVGGYALLHFDLLHGLRSVRLIAWTTLGFGLLLYLTDKFGSSAKPMAAIGVRDALSIGLAQVLALVPGTSRSGITMSAARALGFQRADAARFSMLLSIPTILAAGTLASIELADTDNASLGLDALLAAGFAFAAALAAISLLMRWLEKSDFTPFIIYRVLLGAGLLMWSYASP
jgi:undecaprenyl-diphosphatase